MWIIIISLLVLMVIGVPIGVALAGATALLVSVDPFLTYPALFKSFFSFVSKYSLMAVPFFIYTGFLMEETGLVAGLFEFADALIGWIPGGFAYATLIVSVLFGAISGSSVAMTAAMSLIAYPEMIKRGYPKWMFAGIIASAGGIALLIPPSLSLIIYGVITETPVVSLFFAGIVPGIMLAISDAVIIVLVSLFIKLPRQPFELNRLGRTLVQAWPALLMPVLIMGGLYGGFFTPTETGAVAASYALIYGTIAKRGVFIKQILAVTARSMNLTSLVFFLLGCVGIFQFVLANKGWPQDIAHWITTQGFSRLGFLFILMSLLLLLSTFLTGMAILVLTIPICFPVALTLGVDPIHLGILTTLVIEIGAVIPPVGLNLFTVSGVTGLPVLQVIKGSFPFCISDTCVLVLVILFPALALWIPSHLITSHFG